MKNVQIKNPCKIYSMNGDTCSVCNTLVHDVSNMSNAEIMDLLSGSHKVCINAKKSQLRFTWLQIAATFFISLLVSCGISKKHNKSTWRGTGSFTRIDSTVSKHIHADSCEHIRGTGSFIKRN